MPYVRPDIRLIFTVMIAVKVKPALERDISCFSVYI
jgi:hypothetical protein